MEILEYIKKNLNNQDYDNFIYFFNENEKDKYEEVKGLLTKDYGYLDIVLDFNDFYKIKPLFEQITGDMPCDNKYMKNLIISDYLNYSILKGADIDNNEMGEKLFGGKFSEYIQLNYLLFDFDVECKLKEKAKTTKNKKVRIHFLLDDVEDIELQKCINDLYVYRTGIAMLGYTTKDLLTHYTTNRQCMERVHDYMGFDSEERKESDKQKVKRRNVI